MSFQPPMPRGRLILKVECGRDLENVQLLGQQDPYCIVSYGNEVFRTKTHDDGGRNPHWNQSFVVDVPSSTSSPSNSQDYYVHFTVKDQNVFKDKTIGKAAVKLTDFLTPDGQNKGSRWIQLVDSHNYTSPKGFVLVSWELNVEGGGPAFPSAAAPFPSAASAGPAAFGTPSSPPPPGCPAAARPLAAAAAPLQPNGYLPPSYETATSPYPPSASPYAPAGYPAGYPAASAYPPASYPAASPSPSPAAPATVTTTTTTRTTTRTVPAASSSSPYPGAAYGSAPAAAPYPAAYAPPPPAQPAYPVQQSQQTQNKSSFSTTAVVGAGIGGLLAGALLESAFSGGPRHHHHHHHRHGFGRRW